MYLLSIALIHIFVFFLSLNCSVINNLNNILLFSLPLALSIKEINYNCKNFSYFFLLKYPLSDFTTHHFYFIHFTITFSNHLFIFLVHFMKLLYLIIQIMPLHSIIWVSFIKIWGNGIKLFNIIADQLR